MSKFIVRVLSISLVGFTGCNGSAGLTAFGTVDLRSGGTNASFDLSAPTRLDGSGPVTGACAITQSSSAGMRTYGLVADLQRHSASGVDVHSISLAGQSDVSTGTVSAEFSFNAADGHTEGYEGRACPMTIHYGPEVDQARVVVGDCELWGTSPYNDSLFIANIDMAFSGCVVR